MKVGNEADPWSLENAQTKSPTGARDLHLPLGTYLKNNIWSVIIMGFFWFFLKDNPKSGSPSVFTNAPESVAFHGCSRWTDSLKTMRCILLTHPYPQLHPTHSPVPALTYFCDMSRGAYPPHPPTTAPHVVARQDSEMSLSPLGGSR